jgi:hypothetical protein
MCYNYSNLETVTIFVVMTSEYSINGLINSNPRLQSLIHVTILLYAYFSDKLTPSYLFILQLYYKPILRVYTMHFISKYFYEDMS